MTPEERAKAAIGGYFSGNPAVHALFVADIATAIREAEDAALELASAAAAGRVLRLLKASSDRNLIAQEACDAIRALQHKD